MATSFATHQKPIMASLVARPLEAVHRLFQQSYGSAPGDWGVRAAFEAALADPAVLAQVIIHLQSGLFSDYASIHSHIVHALHA